MAQALGTAAATPFRMASHPPAKRYRKGRARTPMHRPPREPRFLPVPLLRRMPQPSDDRDIEPDAVIGLIAQCDQARRPTGDSARHTRSRSAIRRAHAGTPIGSKGCRPFGDLHRQIVAARRLRRTTLRGRTDGSPLYRTGILECVSGEGLINDTVLRARWKDRMAHWDGARWSTGARHRPRSSGHGRSGPMGCQCHSRGSTRPASPAQEDPRRRRHALASHGFRRSRRRSPVTDRQIPTPRRLRLLADRDLCAYDISDFRMLAVP